MNHYVLTWFSSLEKSFSVCEYWKEKQQCAKIGSLICYKYQGMSLNHQSFAHDCGDSLKPISSALNCFFFVLVHLLQGLLYNLPQIKCCYITLFIYNYLFLAPNSWPMSNFLTPGHIQEKSRDAHHTSHHQCSYHDENSPMLGGSDDDQYNVPKDTHRASHRHCLNHNRTFLNVVH